MNFRLPLWLSIGIACLLAGCSRHQEAKITISGALNYSTPVAFSDDAQLQLLLLDVSAENSSPEIANTTTKIKQLPSQYSLSFDAANINQAHRYTISARIYVNHVLKYATDSAIEVLTQGKGTHVDFPVIATGTNATIAMPTQAAAEVFHGEIRNSNDISLYRAGIVDGHVAWLEEDRSNNTPTPNHNRYEFKGALLTRYMDSTPMEIMFDETGKPRSITRNTKALQVNEEMNAINAVRNRAALLRAHALASQAAQMHRKITKNDERG